MHTQSWHRGTMALTVQRMNRMRQLAANNPWSKRIYKKLISNHRSADGMPIGMRCNSTVKPWKSWRRWKRPPVVPSNSKCEAIWRWAAAISTATSSRCDPSGITIWQRSNWIVLRIDILQLSSIFLLLLILKRCELLLFDVALQEYVMKLEKIHAGTGKSLSFCELNLETWRQLWRVLEISDIILVIADVRYPVSGICRWKTAGHWSSNNA